MRIAAHAAVSDAQAYLRFRTRRNRSAAADAEMIHSVLVSGGGDGCFACLRWNAAADSRGEPHDRDCLLGKQSHNTCVHMPSPKFRLHPGPFRIEKSAIPDGS